MYISIDLDFSSISKIFWKLRDQLRDEANLAPNASNEPERAEGVKRVNLPDPEDCDEKLEARIGGDALELGLNEVDEAACALYTRHKYN